MALGLLVQESKSSECFNKIKTISFTGGEIFLNYPFLYNLLKIVNSSGKISTLISNGFWGREIETVKKIFFRYE